MPAWRITTPGATQDFHHGLLGVAVSVLVLMHVVTIGAAPAEAQGWAAVADGLRGRQLVMRPTVEPGRKAYLGLATVDPAAYALYIGDSLFPLRAREPVTVTGVTARADHLEIELKSQRLGTGRVDFYGAAPTPVEFEAWLDEIFEVVTPAGDFNPYVASVRDQTLHSRSANHLPDADDRQRFHDIESASAAGYHRCPICLAPTPDVTDYQTERVLGVMSLQQIRSAYYPYTNAAEQERVEVVGRSVLAHWPAPLKGYQYSFHLLDSDDVHAFASPTGTICVTRALLDSVGSDEELAMVLAHDIAHIENRHAYRAWRDSGHKLSTVRGIVGMVGIKGAFDAVTSFRNDKVEKAIGEMSAFTETLFLRGYGPAREREADIFASLFFDMFSSLHFGETQESDAHLNRVFRKLRSRQDAFDAYGLTGGDTLFLSHPDIDAGSDATVDTRTAAFPTGTAFEGVNDAGTVVATVTLDIQRLYGSHLNVVATVATTPELGAEDAINTLTLELGARKLDLGEHTAEVVFPSDEVTALFGTGGVRALIAEPVTGIQLKLRNVARWRRVKS